MFKSLILFLNLISCILLLPAFWQARAQTPSCPPLFGGGQICEKHPDLSIDKQVEDPQTKKFIDSLTAVSNFLPDDQTLVFRITIKNTSNKVLSNILLEDTLPATLIYKSGDGKFDSKTHKITDTIDKLEKGQTKMYLINTNINQERLSTSSACSINHALITQNNKKGSDYVKFCINISQSATGQSQDVLSNSNANNSTSTKGGLASLNTEAAKTKGGLPIVSPKVPTKTPDTGPEIVGILGLPFLAYAGYYLRRKTNTFKI